MDKEYILPFSFIAQRYHPILVDASSLEGFLSNISRKDKSLESRTALAQISAESADFFWNQFKTYGFHVTSDMLRKEFGPFSKSDYKRKVKLETKRSQQRERIFVTGTDRDRDRRVLTLRRAMLARDKAKNRLTTALIEQGNVVLLSDASPGEREFYGAYFDHLVVLDNKKRAYFEGFKKRFNYLGQRFNLSDIDFDQLAYCFTEQSAGEHPALISNDLPLKNAWRAVLLKLGLYPFQAGFFIRKTSAEFEVPFESRQSFI